MTKHLIQKILHCIPSDNIFYSCARLWTQSTASLGEFWVQLPPRKAVDSDHYSTLLSCTDFIPGILVLERKLSSWGILILIIISIQWSPDISIIGTAMVNLPTVPCMESYSIIMFLVTMGRTNRIAALLFMNWQPRTVNYAQLYWNLRISIFVAEMI